MFCKTMKFSLFQMLLFAGKQIWPPPLQSDAVRIYKSKGSLTAEQQKSGRNQLWWFVENICWIMYTWHIKKCWNKKKNCKLLWFKCLIKFLALFSFYSAQGFWKCSMTVEKINGKGWHSVCHILCFFFLVFNIN